jgi:soluble lytic murein transglycosylase
MYPNGERIESSYLNVIDALREAEKYSEAAAWVEKTKQRFPGTSTETNAVFARLRMEIGRKNWNEALKNADQLRLLRYPKGTMTNPDEVTFLRAFVLEKLGKREDAINAYFAIPDNISSYYGGLATERLNNLVTDTRRASLQDRQARVRNAAAGVSAQFPALYRDELLREAASRRVDPRFVLSIMKQESSFKANAKSPAAARGLLQLTVDTSAKYTAQAKITNLQAEDLYRPSVNIALGSVYLAELQKQFPNLLEAVAASYNGGEDNAERWLKRANSKEPFMFTAEVGFAESKDYVFKVLGNYRVYRELYTEDLRRK